MKTDDNPQSMERIARYLDGEKGVLTAEEQLLAAQIDRQQRSLGKAMDEVSVPREAMERARRRMTVQLVRPVYRMVKVLSVAAAAAAVIVASLVLWSVLHGPSPVAPTSSNGGENPLADVVNDMASTDSGKLELISAMAMDKDELQVVIETTNPKLLVEAPEEGN